MTTTETRTQTRKSERLEARVSLEQKQLIQHAAALRGQTVTDFVVSSVHEAAQRAVHKEALMTLTVADQRAFVAALLEDAEPTPRLKEAFQRHRGQTGS